MSARGAVLVVSPYRAEYGPARVLEHVLSALTAEGYRAVCVTPPEARSIARARELGFEVRTVGALTTFPRTLNVLRLIRFFFGHLGAAQEIQRIAEEVNARAVYSVSEAIFAAPLAARRSGLPSVVHAIGMSIGRPRWGARVYIRFLARLADRFIACSSAVAEMFAEHGVDDAKLVVVHNAIDVAEVEAAEAGRPEMDPGIHIGMFAAYDPRKGHDLFVEAAAIVAKQRPDARFVLVGGVLPEHGDSRRFEAHVSRLIDANGLRARFAQPGYVSVPDVYEWMRAMDVIVVPSRTEAFAHALLEAMVCARPIVATAIEGNLDAFVDGHSGLYAPREAKGLAEAILRLLDDAGAAAAMGEAAARRARAYFDVSATLPAVSHTVSLLLDARR